MNKYFSTAIIAAMLMSCGNKAKQADQMILQKQMTIDSMNAAAAKQRAVDSMKTVNYKREEKVTQNYSNAGYASPAATTTTTTTTAKKKGWSTPAKGAAIGAGVGIISGAIIDKKNRGVGAAVGGLVGAGVGAGTGAVIDSKNKNN